MITSLLALLLGNGSYIISGSSSSSYLFLFPWFYLYPATDGAAIHFAALDPKGWIHWATTLNTAHGAAIRLWIPSWSHHSGSETFFYVLKSENPYNHLSDFERFCSLFVESNMAQETLMWKLFPYHLIGKAEQWYTYNVGSVNDSWGELRDNFCLTFILVS